MKSAKEFWKEKFDEYPQTDADKLAVAMMAEYGKTVSINLDAYNKMLAVLKNIDNAVDAYAPDWGLSNSTFNDVSEAIALAEQSVSV